MEVVLRGLSLIMLLTFIQVVFICGKSNLMNVGKRDNIIRKALRGGERLGE